jgi:hypothetical protein
MVHQFQRSSCLGSVCCLRQHGLDRPGTTGRVGIGLTAAIATGMRLGRIPCESLVAKPHIRMFLFFSSFSSFIPTSRSASSIHVRLIGYLSPSDKKSSTPCEGHRPAALRLSRVLAPRFPHNRQIGDVRTQHVL